MPDLLSEHLRSLSRSSTTPQTLLDIAEDVQELEAEIARLKLLAQSAVDYYAVNSQHPSEAHDILREALNPTITGDES
jgi:hypothetical protein